jgi:hypothetical protein
MYACIETVCSHAFLRISHNKKCTYGFCDDILLYGSCDAILPSCQTVLALKLYARVCTTIACQSTHQSAQAAQWTAHDNSRICDAPITEHATYYDHLLHHEPLQASLSKQCLLVSTRTGYWLGRQFKRALRPTGQVRASKDQALQRPWWSHFAWYWYLVSHLLSWLLQPMKMQYQWYRTTAS